MVSLSKLMVYMLPLSHSYTKKNLKLIIMQENQS